MKPLLVCVVPLVVVACAGSSPDAVLGDAPAADAGAPLALAGDAGDAMVAPDSPNEAGGPPGDAAGDAPFDAAACLFPPAGGATSEACFASAGGNVPQAPGCPVCVRSYRCEGGPPPLGPCGLMQAGAPTAYYCCGTSACTRYAPGDDACAAGYGYWSCPAGTTAGLPATCVTSPRTDPATGAPGRCCR